MATLTIASLLSLCGCNGGAAKDRPQATVLFTASKTGVNLETAAKSPEVLNAIAEKYRNVFEGDLKAVLKELSNGLVVSKVEPQSDVYRLEVRTNPRTVALIVLQEWVVLASKHVQDQMAVADPNAELVKKKDEILTKLSNKEAEYLRAAKSAPLVFKGESPVSRCEDLIERFRQLRLEIESAASPNVDRLAQVATQYRDPKSSQGKLDLNSRLLTELKSALARQPAGSAMPDPHKMLQKMIELRELEDQLGANHPRVVALTGEVAELKRLVSAATTPKDQPKSPKGPPNDATDIDATGILAFVDQRIEVLKAELRKLSELDKKTKELLAPLEKLRVEVEDLRVDLNEAVEKLEMGIVKHSKEANRQRCKVLNITQELRFTRKELEDYKGLRKLCRNLPPITERVALPK